jgi:hypothetical protein
MFSWALLNPVCGIVLTVAVCMGNYRGRVSGRSRGDLKNKKSDFFEFF